MFICTRYRYHVKWNAHCGVPEMKVVLKTRKWLMNSGGNKDEQTLSTVSTIQACGNLSQLKGLSAQPLTCTATSFTLWHMFCSSLLVWAYLYWVEGANLILEAYSFLFAFITMYLYTERELVLFVFLSIVSSYHIQVIMRQEKPA